MQNRENTFVFCLLRRIRFLCRTKINLLLPCTISQQNIENKETDCKLKLNIKPQSSEVVIDSFKPQDVTLSVGAVSHTEWLCLCVQLVMLSQLFVENDLCGDICDCISIWTRNTYFCFLLVSRLSSRTTLCTIAHSLCNLMYNLSERRNHGNALLSCSICFHCQPTQHIWPWSQTGNNIPHQTANNQDELQHNI